MAQGMVLLDHNSRHDHERLAESGRNKKFEIGSRGGRQSHPLIVDEDGGGGDGGNGNQTRERPSGGGWMVGMMEKGGRKIKRSKGEEE